MAIADATIDVSDFNAAVTQANTATGQTTRANNATLFTLSNATAFNGGTASDFATLLTSETNGLISGGITTQALTVDDGTIGVSAANDLNNTTTGVVTAKSQKVTCQHWPALEIRKEASQLITPTPLRLQTPQ